MLPTPTNDSIYELYKKHYKVLNTIDHYNSFISKDVFLNGGCYLFHVLLKTKFNEAISYYNQDHVISRLEDNYYDANGLVQQTDNYLPLDTERKDIEYFNIEPKGFRWKRI